MINEDLQKFLTQNYPNLAEQREKDNKAWEDMIAHIIVSMDQHINSLESTVYQLEAAATAASEDRDAAVDGSDSTFMDEDAKVTEDDTQS